jgi:hypothetical protein
MRYHLRYCISRIALAWLVPATLVWSQERQPHKDAADGMKAWYAFYHHEAAHAYRFTMEPGDVELELDPTPVLRWTNPLEEGSLHGVVYIWRHKGRPVVVGQLFSYLNGKGGRVYCHAMHSLAHSDEKVIGQREGKTFWTPDSPGVELHDVPEAPAPAAGRAARLSQMKEISRRFSAYTEEAARGKRILRLLPTPMDRYPENAAAGTDGALFSLVVGNDPEVILHLEQGQQQDGKPVWQYGVVLSTRSTSVALLDDREVWRYDATGKNPGDPRGGYLSVHGIATLPLAAPAREAEKP